MCEILKTIIYLKFCYVFFVNIRFLLIYIPGSYKCLHLFFSDVSVVIMHLHYIKAISMCKELNKALLNKQKA